MAVYTSDLSVIDLAEATTDWSAYGGGGAGLGVGPDFAIQGVNALDKQVSGSGTIKGAMHNDATITLGASDHIFGWIFAATPGILETLVNGGKRFSIGTGTTARNDYYLEGADTRPEGGNKCYCIRYSTAVPSPGSQTGTPGAIPTYFGGGLHTTASSKAVNLGLDAFRYGTGAYLTAGDITDPGTFAGFASEDELLVNKWGILFRVNGTFQLQGRFVIGQDNTGTATATHFDDSSGAVITLTDTPFSQTDFTQIIIDHASTICNISNLTVLALGTNNPGRLVFNNVLTDSTLTSCTFDAIGISTLRAGVTINECIFRDVGLITQNGATIADCNIKGDKNSVKAVLSDNPALISDSTFDIAFLENTFYFDGSDVPATDSGVDWTDVTNADDGSTSTYAFTNVGDSSTLSIEGTNFTTSGDIVTIKVRVNMIGSFGKIVTNEIYENGGVNLLGTITHNKDGRSDYVELLTHSGGWTESKIQALESKTFTGAGSGVQLYKIEILAVETGGHGIELDTPGTYTLTNNKFSGFAGIDGSTGREAIYNNSGGTITLNIAGGGDTPTIRNGTGATTTVVNAVAVKVTAKQASDSSNIVGARVYLTAAAGGDLATGTVILNGLTSASGIVEDTGFSYTNDQPVIGRVRKGTTSPLYKTSPLSGTITSSGFETTAFMASDE